MKYDDPEVIVRALARRFQQDLFDIGIYSPLNEDTIVAHCQAAAAVFWHGLLQAGFFSVTGAKGQAVKYDSYVQ